MSTLRGVASASAIAAAVVIIGASAAWAVPPREAARFPGVANAAPAAAPAVPTFVNGLSQAVFATGQANWVNHELWVETTMDTDFDGRRDRVHVDVSRPTETETDGLDVPVIYEDSPYYAGGADVTNWAVDHEIGEPPDSRPRAPFFAAGNTSPTISTSHENTWVPRGFAVVHSESPGTGHSDGCPNSGAPIETAGATAVIDWLNGRAKGYTTRTGDVEVAADWTTGKVGMIGTSYNGTLPIAAASTGVEGLEAIVPISAISDWYDYYRANGMVRAPGGFQGEDLDVLTEYIYSRADEVGERTKCWPTINEVAANQDRVTGNRSAFWQERNYMKDVGNLEAATLARARQQRLQRDDEARRAALRRAEGAGRAAPVLLPPGRARRRAAGRAHQLLVHALPVGAAERRREPAEVVGGARGRTRARRVSRPSPASSPTPPRWRWRTRARSGSASPSRSRRPTPTGRSPAPRA